MCTGGSGGEMHQMDRLSTVGRMCKVVCKVLRGVTVLTRRPRSVRGLCFLLGPKRLGVLHLPLLGGFLLPKTEQCNIAV